MRSYLERGYTVVKMKIGGELIAHDRRRIEAVLNEIGSHARLAVDANGRFDLETAIAYAKMLRDYDLFWYEEAGDPLDYRLQAALAEFYSGSMATGENLFSHQDARNLIRHGGMRALWRLSGRNAGAGQRRYTTRPAWDRVRGEIRPVFGDAGPGGVGSMAPVDGPVNKPGHDG
jgi:hypothetical protein